MRICWFKTLFHWWSLFVINNCLSYTFVIPVFYHSHCLSYAIVCQFLPLVISFPVVCNSPLSAIPHCLWLTIFCDYYCLSFTIVSRVSLSAIHNCLKNSIVCHFTLSVIHNCLSFTIICYSPLSIIRVMCHSPLSLITYCLLYTIVCHHSLMSGKNSQLALINNGKWRTTQNDRQWGIQDYGWRQW